MKFEKACPLPLIVNRPMQLQLRLLMHNWYIADLLALLYLKYDSKK